MTILTAVETALGNTIPSISPLAQPSLLVHTISWLLTGISWNGANATRRWKERRREKKKEKGKKNPHEHTHMMPRNSYKVPSIKRKI